MCCWGKRFYLFILKDNKLLSNIFYDISFEEKTDVDLINIYSPSYTSNLEHWSAFTQESDLVGVFDPKDAYVRSLLFGRNIEANLDLL